MNAEEESARSIRNQWYADNDMADEMVPWEDLSDNEKLDALHQWSPKDVQKRLEREHKRIGQPLVIL